MFRQSRDIHDKYRYNNFRLMPIPMYSILTNNKVTLKDLLKFDKDDFFISIVSLSITIITWISFRYFSGSFQKMFYYWDSCDSFLYSEIRRLNNSNLDPIKNNYKHFQYSDVFSPLPFQRIILKLFKIISFGSFKFAQIFYTLFFSVFSCFVFKRLLFVFNLVRNPVYTTILFCLFPVRFVLYRSVSTYDTLFITLILLSFISYRIGQHLLLLIFVVCACLTRYEGWILFLVFFILYLINFDLKNVISIFSVSVVVLFVYKYKYTNYKNFIIPQALMANRDPHEFRLSPFFYYFQLRGSIANLRQIHALEMVYFPAFFGSAVLLFVNVPLSLFCFIYSVFVTCIKSNDLHRFAIPVHSICVLIGLDSFLSQKTIQFCILVISPFLFLLEMYYCGHQIDSRQIPYFLSNVLQN